MLAMLGLGVLLPIIKNTDFFPDESFWIYWAVITIFYILMHSVEYEKKSNWDMYRATFPINGREIDLLCNTKNTKNSGESGVFKECSSDINCNGFGFLYWFGFDVEI